VLVVGDQLAKCRPRSNSSWAVVVALDGPDVLLFIACAGISTLGSLDIDARERSVEVNVKTFRL